MITLITRDGCDFCEKAKKLLTDKEQPFTVKTIGENISREEVLNKYPTQTKLPIVIDSDDNLIGGYVELYIYLNPPEGD